MEKQKREEYVERLTENLPVIRKKLGLTQKELADIIGVSSYTILAIENGRRKMSWSTFLSIILICTRNENVCPLLSAFNIYSDELSEFIEVQK